MKRGKEKKKGRRKERARQEERRMEELGHFDPKTRVKKQKQEIYIFEKE